MRVVLYQLNPSDGSANGQKSTLDTSNCGTETPKIGAGRFMGRTLHGSIPHISFVVLDFVTPQECLEFVLERNPPMVLAVFGGEDKVRIDSGKRLWHSFAVLAPFQGAFGSLNGSPGHRPDGLSPGLGSTGPLGRKRRPAGDTERKSVRSAIKQ